MAIKILLVDDDLTQLMILKGYLHGKNLEFFEATSGKQALALIEKHDFALILTDVQMPEMNGFELAAAIRQLQQAQHIPIIFMSATHNSDQAVFQGYDAGAVDYLAKPVIPHILKSKVAVFMDLYQQKQELLDKNLEMRNDLEMAAEVQQSILPKYPQVPYLKLTSRYLPYGKVSGDIYDFGCNREGALNVFLGDASGHGVAAAFMTMMVHIGLDHLPPNTPTPEAIRSLNQLLSAKKTGRYMTGLYLRIYATGKLEVTHAGHPALIVIPQDEGSLVLIKGDGCGMGMFDHEYFPFSEEAYQLQPGDKFLVYTDGLTEWHTKELAIYGEKRLIASLEQHRHLELDELLDTILQDAAQHAQGNPCDDDLTILGFEFFGSPQ